MAAISAISSLMFCLQGAVGTYVDTYDETIIIGEQEYPCESVITIQPTPSGEVVGNATMSVDDQGWKNKMLGIGVKFYAMNLILFNLYNASCICMKLHE